MKDNRPTALTAMRSRARHGVPGWLVVALALSLSPGGPAAARTLGIVLDDSGSMHTGRIFATSSYAVQLMLALSRDDDRLLLAPLSAGHDQPWDTFCHPDALASSEALGDGTDDRLPAATRKLEPTDDRLLKAARQLEPVARNTYYRSILNLLACAAEQGEKEIFLAIIADGNFNEPADTAPFAARLAEWKRNHPGVSVRIALLRLVAGGQSVTREDILAGKVVVDLAREFGPHFELHLVQGRDFGPTLLRLTQSLSGLSGPRDMVKRETNALTFTPRFDTSRLIVQLETPLDLAPPSGADDLRQVPHRLRDHRPAMRAADGVFQQRRATRVLQFSFLEPLKRGVSYRLPLNASPSEGAVQILVNADPFIEWRLERSERPLVKGSLSALALRFVHPDGLALSSPPVFHLRVGDHTEVLSNGSREGDHTWVLTHGLTPTTAGALNVQVEVLDRGQRWRGPAGTLQVIEPVEISVQPDWPACPDCDAGSATVRAARGAGGERLDVLPVMAGVSRAGRFVLDWQGDGLGYLSLRLPDGTRLDAARRSMELDLDAGEHRLMVEMADAFQPAYRSSQPLSLRLRSDDDHAAAGLDLSASRLHAVALQGSLPWRFDLATAELQATPLQAWLDGAPTGLLQEPTLTATGMPDWLILQRNDTAEGSAWSPTVDLPWWWSPVFETPGQNPLRFEMAATSGERARLEGALEIWSSTPMWRLWAGFLLKCLGALLLLIWLVGMFRKDRFARNAHVELRDGQRPRPRSKKLRGNWFSRLLPYVPHRCNIEGFHLLAGASGASIRVQGSRRDNDLEIDGLEAVLDSKGRAILRENNEVWRRNRPQRTLTYLRK